MKSNSKFLRALFNLPTKWWTSFICSFVKFCSFPESLQDRNDTVKSSDIEINFFMLTGLGWLIYYRLFELLMFQSLIVAQYLQKLFNLFQVFRWTRRRRTFEPKFIR